MRPDDAARELEAMLDAERLRQFGTSPAAAADAIRSRRRIEALELALSLLDVAALRGRRATVLNAHEWEAAFAALEAERARGDRAAS